MLYASKIAEINDSDRYLFKKSKILKIGSVEKKLRFFIVGNISKKSESPRIFVIYIQGFEPKTVLSDGISDKSRKVFSKVALQFWCYRPNFWAPASIRAFPIN